jgi:DNA primase small subunit
MLRAPAQGSPGWGGRVNRSIISFVERVRSLEEEEAIKVLSKSKGIGTKKAAVFYKSLSGDGVLDKIRAGNLDLFKGSTDIWKRLLAEDLDGEGVRVGISLDEERGETDEPVTADIRRLIRCPGSLHGGSGFRVTPLTVTTLEDFDPLNDAVVFGEDHVSIRVTRPFKTEVLGESYNLSEGPLEVPMGVAIFLMARGVAELR